ncbi:MAG: flagellar basal-body rod protein FlgF [Hyphomicrobiales bacterium]|nr:flagellar basal-body rod protein FlgF [Hyphomicrobiales bacterium]
MHSSFYVGAAALTALDRRLSSVAHNVANGTTIGFRAEGVRFETAVASNGSTGVAFPDAGQDYISQANGALIKTGNPLDLAVKGAGWFGLMSPDGPVYTRDGRFEIASTGELRSVNGYGVLDASGAPMLLDPNGGPVTVAADGVVSQSGRQAGAVGLFVMDPGATLSRYDNSAVRSDKPPGPPLEFSSNGVAQGFLEQSNVDPVRELTRLIQIQRTFENIAASLDMQDASARDAIKTLGGS